MEGSVQYHGRGRPRGEVNAHCVICGRGMHQTPSKAAMSTNPTCGWPCRRAFIQKERERRAENTNCLWCGETLNHVTKCGTFTRKKKFCDHYCASRWVSNNPESKAKWIASIQKYYATRDGLETQYVPQVTGFIPDPYAAVYD